jgi:signal transduction histidine kinase
VRRIKTVGAHARFNHTDGVIIENDMNSKSASSPADFRAALPGGQYRGLYLLAYVIILLALGLTLYSHWGHATGMHGWADAALIGLVVIQALLYLFFTVLPTLTRWPAWPWFGDLRGGLVDPGPSRRWWWMYIVASVAIVLAESRIDRAFQWFLFPYICHIFARPFRISVPAILVVLAAFLLNLIGWSKPATWDARDWFSVSFTTAAWLFLAFFVARMVVTSAERGRLILELQAAKRELELAREREVELAALRERERLARDLHDTLGHALVTLTVQLEAAQRLQAADPARVATLLAEMQKLTRSSMEDLRRSLANLRTSGLGDRPLTESLRTLCAEAGRRFGAAIDCRVAEGADALPPAVAEVLWRVAQEGLTNIEKHAHANHVQVNLTLHPKEVVLRVSDDGAGLPREAENKPGHYGLRGLRERVEGLGGTFTVAMAGTNGTLIEAQIPVIA